MGLVMKPIMIEGHIVARELPQECGTRSVTSCLLLFVLQDFVLILELAARTEVTTHPNRISGHSLSSTLVP